jgi:tetratricopeptide (TPR) repeat protein
MRDLVLVTSAICVLGGGTPAVSVTLQEWSECLASPPWSGIAACTRIIEDPASSRSERAAGYANRAMIRRRMRDIDGALVDAQKAVRLQGTQRSVRAKVWLDRGDYNRALDDRTETVRQDGSAFSYFDRGVVLFAKGDFAAAARDFMHARGIPYASGWLFLARTRASENHTSDLRNEELKRPEIQLLLGERSTQDVIAASAHDGERCKALFFAAERDLLRGRKSDAVMGLKQAVEACREWNDAFSGPGAPGRLLSRDERFYSNWKRPPASEPQRTVAFGICPATSSHTAAVRAIPRGA